MYIIFVQLSNYLCHSCCIINHVTVTLTYVLPEIENEICTNEPRCEKTGLRGFRPGPTQIGLYCHRRWLETRNFGFRKVVGLFYLCSENKGADQLRITAQLICVFVFAYAKSRFSHNEAQICTNYANSVAKSCISFPITTWHTLFYVNRLNKTESTVFNLGRCVSKGSPFQFV